jgi:predicted GIY-YIG superfamily endonuclease
MSEFTYIYILKHPYEKEAYIGKSDNPWRRYKQHMRDKRVLPKTDWLMEMKSYNLRPNLDILDRVHKSNWEVEEKRWTRKYILKGYKIFNSTNRGIGHEKFLHRDR